MQSQSDLERAMVSQRSFTTPAVITMVLYFVLYIPGIIANLLYLNEAYQVQRITGQSPPGKGCLITQLFVFVILPVIGVCLFCLLTGGFYAFYAFDKQTSDFLQYLQAVPK